MSEETALADATDANMPGAVTTTRVLPWRRPGLHWALVREARPKQWPKNVLVAAAPGAAGVLSHGTILWKTSLAFAAFCLVASGTYFLNDARDAEADRSHPRKQHRPVAAGVLSVRLAIVVGVLMMATGAVLGAVVNVKFLEMLGVYVALTTSYTLVLKRIAVVDLAAVASGFIIRAVAGGVAATVPISKWFLLVASFGSLFIVAGKRHGEHIDLGEDRTTTRATLGDYPESFLRFVWMMAAGVTVTAYCLWAFEQASLHGGFPWYELDIIPFVLGVLRYALLLDQGGGGTPEDIVLGDRTLQVIGVLWVAVFGLAVYVGR